MTVITRFAPSPTGLLHIGSVRTALFAWLYARQQQGKFILRIEDTDQERSTKSAVDVILDGLQWLGLTWDEGPFYQSLRLTRYEQVAEELVTQGLAYNCYCSKQRLADLKAQQSESGEKPHYDRHCLTQPAATATERVIRLKMPQTGTTTFNDLVYGQISVANQELDDFIIMRSDNTPTYNFAVVVDDIDMAITHVIRGDDHLNNTPKQIHLFTALKATLPTFAHVPMILGADGSKLSKRHGAVSVLEYQTEGYLPAALLNALVRLGWSHGDQELFTVAEMQQLFKLEDVNKSPARFDRQKLDWLNQHYMQSLPVAELIPIIAWQFTQQKLDVTAGPDYAALLTLQKTRVKNLKDLVTQSAYFYQDTVTYNPAAVKKYFNINSAAILEFIIGKIEGVVDWQKTHLDHIISAAMAHFVVKMPDIALPLRVALTGNDSSPAIGEVMLLLGKDKVVARLHAAIKYIEHDLTHFI